jgi:hypothetical protein
VGPPEVRLRINYLEGNFAPLQNATMKRWITLFAMAAAWIAIIAIAYAR